MTLERSVIMNKIFNRWLIGKVIADNQKIYNINNYEPTIIEPRKKDITIYEYWPAFDNDIPTLAMAEQFYEENRICHVIQDGICKCFFEFDGDEGYLKTEPKKFFDRI